MATLDSQQCSDPCSITHFRVGRTCLVQAFQCLLDLPLGSFHAVTQVASSTCCRPASEILPAFVRLPYTPAWWSEPGWSVFQETLPLGQSLVSLDLVLCPYYCFSCSLKQTVVPVPLAGIQGFGSSGAVGQMNVQSLLYLSIMATLR